MRSRTGNIVLVFLTFLSMGASATVLGASLPQVLGEFGWHYGIVGMIFAANAAGYFFATIGAGLVLEKFGIRILLIGGLVAQGIGMLVFGWTSSWGANMGVFVGVGIGQGFLEVSGNYAVLQLDDTGRSRLMNLIHSAFTLGAIFAPWSVGFLLGYDQGWPVVFSFVGWFSLLLSVALAFLLLEYPIQGEVRSLRSRSWGDWVSPFLVLAMAAILFYVGAEMGFSSWLSEFAVRVHGQSEAVGSYVVSVFWVGILAGRLGMALGYSGRRHEFVLVGASSWALICLTGLLLVKQPLVFFLGAFGTGLGLSVVYPTIMVLVGERYPENRGMAIGVIASGGGLGAFFFPLVMGVLSERTSLETGFWFYWAVTALLVGTAVCLRFGADANQSVPPAE